jgi:hypothetical protein
MKHAALLAVIFAVAALLVHDKIAFAPWGYDEADYMFAASLGIGNNWHDSGTMPITQFVSTGRRQGTDPQQRAALSALARNSDDPLVYRHWHGPLYFFYLSAVSKLGLDEHGTRIFSFAFIALTALLMYFASMRILGGTEGQIAAILSSALFLWSPVTLQISELAPHMLFVLIYIGLLLLLTNAATGAGKRYYYAGVCCAALAFCTLEVAFVEILVVGIFAWRYRAKLGPHLIRNSIGVFLGTVLIVWPTALLKLSFAKAYLVMAYLAVFRKGAWGNVTFSETWIDRFEASPAEWCLLAIALIVFFAPGKPRMPERARTGAAIFLLFSGLMILANIKVYTDITRYVTVFLAALELFTGWMLARILARIARPWLRFGTLAAVCALLIWNAHYGLSGFMTQEDPRPMEMLRAIRENGVAEKTLVAPRGYLPIFHYYFPHMRIVGYDAESQIPAMRDQGDAVLYEDASLKLNTPGRR